jgi:hypothetical protein
MSNAKPNPERLTEFIPITTMVEVPILSDSEKAEFMASLEAGKREIADGRGLTFTAEEFGSWLSKSAAEARARKIKHV